MSGWWGGFLNDLGLAALAGVSTSWLRVCGVLRVGPLLPPQKQGRGGEQREMKLGARAPLKPLLVLRLRLPGIGGSPKRVCEAPGVKDSRRALENWADFVKFL